MVLLSFLFFLLLFVAVGAASVLRGKGTNEDYLLAGQSVKPWLVALSAVATCNSGYMFVGQIAYTFEVGLASIWLMIGWLIGDLLASLAIYRPLREVAEEQNVMSFGGILAKWRGTDFTRLRMLVGIVTVLFLGTYAAAQLKAGSTALHVIFDWDMSWGAIIGFVIVVIYCFAGGIRASIWTDAAQSIVMIGAMFILLGSAVMEAGGMGSLIEKLDAVSPTYLELAPELELGTTVGLPLYIAGWFFAGFGTAGQPHITIRYMTLDDPSKIRRVRVLYYTWYTIFYVGSISVGLVARVLVPDADPELAMATLAQSVLPEILVGVILAGLFAATMSTADSQILSSSAALTRDIMPNRPETTTMTKGATLLVALIALGIALFAGSTVFNLVLVAWSALGAAFAPLLFLYAFGRKVTEATAIAMVLAGVSVTVLWRALGWGDYIYEICPGMLAGFAVAFAARSFPSSPAPVGER